MGVVLSFRQRLRNSLHDLPVNLEKDDEKSLENLSAILTWAYLLGIIE